MSTLGPYAPSPLFGVEDGKDMLVRHEALFHVADFEVVQGQHVLLLFLLKVEGKGLHLSCLTEDLRMSQAGLHHEDHH